MKIKIYIFKCPVCEKVLPSLSESQAITNAKHHLAKHLVEINDTEVRKYIKIKNINSF